MIMSWLLSASVIQILSKWSKGTGSFEQTLAVIGLSISIAMWGTLVHDLAMSFFSAIQVIDARQHEIAMNSPTIWRTLLWISILIYLAAFLLLFSKAVRAVHKISVTASTGIGIAGFITFQLVFLIFNR
jgi:ABC-type microcin C transport system permease subunit YejB